MVRHLFFAIEGAFLTGLFNSSSSSFSSSRINMDREGLRDCARGGMGEGRSLTIGEGDGEWRAASDCKKAYNAGSIPSGSEGSRDWGHGGRGEEACSSTEITCNNGEWLGASVWRKACRSVSSRREGRRDCPRERIGEAGAFNTSGTPKDARDVRRDAA